MQRATAKTLYWYVVILYRRHKVDTFLKASTYLVHQCCILILYHSARQGNGCSPKNNL